MRENFFRRRTRLFTNRVRTVMSSKLCPRKIEIQQKVDVLTNHLFSDSATGNHGGDRHHKKYTHGVHFRFRLFRNLKSTKRSDNIRSKKMSLRTSKLLHRKAFVFHSHVSAATGYFVRLMATIVHHFFGFREPEESVVPTVESQSVSGQLSVLLHGAKDNVGMPNGRALYSGRASHFRSGGV